MAERVFEISKLENVHAILAVVALCRQNFARGKAGRHSSRAADQIRSGCEPDHREGARPHRAADAARPRRRGDRIRTEFAALRSVAIGTEAGRTD